MEANHTEGHVDDSLERLVSQKVWAEDAEREG